MNYSYFVGIDLSKKTFDASVITAGCHEVDHFQLANTPSGMNALLTRLEKLGIQPATCFFVRKTWELTRSNYACRESPVPFL